MLETALRSFTTFFATIGPLEAAVLFATLTPKMAYAERQSIAVRATLIASAILAFFTLLGGPILNQLGVSIAALQTAGGVILLVIAIDMIFARPGGSIKLTPPEGAEAQSRDDVAVFPLATPLLAGPGAMSAGILLAANAHGEPLGLAVVMGALGCCDGVDVRASRSCAAVEPSLGDHGAARSDPRLRHSARRARGSGAVQRHRVIGADTRRKAPVTPLRTGRARPNSVNRDGR